MMLFMTARTVVRQFGVDDLDAFAGLCAQADVMRLMGDGATLPRETVAQWIEVCAVKYGEQGYGTSAVVDASQGALMGFCGVVRAAERHFDELIYAFDPLWWGQGYATEVGRAMLWYVFGVSALDAIYATINEHHAASLAVVAKLGMTFVRREVEESGGDTLVYGVRREDFRQGMAR